MNLKDISLGAPAAERDRSLTDYFVRSDIYDDLKSGRANILLGNRGSGKSAIFRYIAEEEKKNGTGVFIISPDEYSYEFLNEALKREVEGAWAKQGSYAASWKYVLIILAMKEACASFPNTRNSSYKAIKQFLRDNISGQQDGILDTLISYMKRFEGLKIAGYDFSGKTRDLRSLYDLESISSLVKHLQGLLHQRKIMIFIDELDRGWDASEDAKLFVAGLFQAAQYVNSLSPNLRVLISLRQELYDNIPEIYDDAQKVRDIIRQVKWNEEGLLQLAGKRIKSALRLNPNISDEQAWETIFSPTLEYRQTRSFKYIIDRTTYRPREVIHFCNERLSSCPADQLVVDYNIISKAEEQYSLERINDICSEFKFQYPGLREILETFRGDTYKFTRDEIIDSCINIILEEKCPSAANWLCSITEERLLSILWETGFVQALSVGAQFSGDKSGSRYLGVYKAPSMNLKTIQQFQVHPMFRRALSMREKK